MDPFSLRSIHEDVASMDVDDEIVNLCKKRPREEDREDKFQKKMSISIHRAVTTEEGATAERGTEELEDSLFVSTLLGDDTASTTQPSTAYEEIATTDDSIMPAVEEPAAQSFVFETRIPTSEEDPKQELDISHQSDNTAETALAKMPAVEAPRFQPAAASKSAPTMHSKPPTDEAPTQLSALPIKFAPLPPLSGMASMAQNDDLPPPTINMDKFVERWTCDVCKSCSFETFKEAQAHENQCKLFHEAKKKSEEEQLKSRMSEAADTLTTLALQPPKDVQMAEGESKTPAKRHVAINLIPQGEASAMLSDYNNLLVRNIEFFFPSSDNRVGLRCVHCKDHHKHITAATFFPSAIGSISAGLGTIGARHFGWGKCPLVQPETVRKMIETKKTSGLQTRSHGRVGLDAYCKNLAKQYGIIDDENSGISWIEGTEPNFDITDELLQRKLSTSSRESARSSSDNSSDADSNSIASVLAKMKHDVKNIETRPFVPSNTPNFWECSGCRSIPFDFRTKGSVVFSVGEPAKEKVEGHLKFCTGGKLLAIPRSAAIEPYYGHDVPSIKVKWDSSQYKRSSGRRRRYDLASVNPGVEDIPLCFPDDQQFTTEFAYYVVTKLKKCYLVRAGGSRGNCPIGFPGLACGWCAGTPNERRFFYTSADHLRNSFSHIPSHMAECSACPAEVKARIEKLKIVRNKQKSQLKTGYHKIFIDRVWERMHGPLALTDDDTDGGDPIAFAPRADFVPDARNSTPSNARPISTALVDDADRAFTSDLIYFTLLNVLPYKTAGHSSSSEEDENSREIGFPGVCCKFCAKTPKGRKFFTVGPQHLGGLLLSISDHMVICKDCPKQTIGIISSYKASHEMQMQQLKEGEHDDCMRRVWKKMFMLNRAREAVKASNKPLAKATAAAPRIPRVPIQYKTVDANMKLVTAEVESLVTPFTYFTMQQVQPCNLDNSGNGSRSCFDFGFPGLECLHCAGQPNSRRFFYRTAEILGGKKKKTVMT